MLRLLLAVLHLLGLGIGLGAVWARARALGSAAAGAVPDVGTLRRAFAADTWWGVAAGLWIVTGLWRLLGGTEKATTYYWGNHVFMAKLGLLAVILVLEVWPMITLIRWRGVVARGDAVREGAIDAGAARRIATISYVQAALVVAMVGAAVAMARGFGSR